MNDSFTCIRLTTAAFPHSLWCSCDAVPGVFVFHSPAILRHFPPTRAWLRSQLAPIGEEEGRAAQV